MRRPFRLLVSALIAVLLLPFGAAIGASAAGATALSPNYVVSTTDSLTNPTCPQSWGDTPTIEPTLAAAVDAADVDPVTGDLIYVCAGNYEILAPVTYSVDYETNSGVGGTLPTDQTGNAPGSTVTVASGAELTGPDGMTFDGWNTESTGSGTWYAAGSSIQMESDLTLYPIFETGAAATVTITYNANADGTGTVTDSTSYAPGANVTVLGDSGITPLSGYTFLAWNTEANGDGTWYTQGSQFSIQTNTTLYAQYWENSFGAYSITYVKPSGASGSAPTGPLDYSIGAWAEVLSVGSLSETGYTFEGWNTASDGSGTWYQPDGYLSLQGDLTLYPIFIASDLDPDGQLTINHGLTIEGPSTSAASTVDPSTQAVLSDFAGFQIDSNYVTITGLTFSGGSDSISDSSATSGTSGDQGESNVTISDNLFSGVASVAGDDGDVHLGLAQSGNPDSVSYLDTNDKVEGNVFEMTVGSENEAMVVSDTKAAQITGNDVVYPADDDNSLSAIVLDGFDDATTVSDNTLTGGGIDQDVAQPNLQDPTSGVIIADANSVAPYGNGCSDQNIENNVISGFVVGISVISDGVDEPSANPLCTTGPTDFQVSQNTISGSRATGIYVDLVDSETGSVVGNTVSGTDSPGLTEYGYDVGWFNDPDGVDYAPGQYDFIDNSTSPAVVTWSDNVGVDNTSSPSTISTCVSCTVTYDGADAASGTSPSDVQSPYAVEASVTVLGNTGDLTPPTSDPSGYAFAGWSTQPDASTVTYTVGSSFTILQNMILYPVFEQSYTVTYDAGSATGTPPNDTSSPYVSGSTVTVLGQGTLSEPGDTFVGWNTASNGSGTNYTVGSTFTIQANVTLYPVFIHVNINNGGGSSGGTGGSGGDSGGTGGSGGSGGNGGDPSAVLRVLNTARMTGEIVDVSVDCSNARCAGVLRLTTTGADARVIGNTTYSAAAGTSHEVAIRLDGTGVALVKALHHARYVAELTFTYGKITKLEKVAFTTP